MASRDVAETRLTEAAEVRVKGEEVFIRLEMECKQKEGQRMEGNSEGKLVRRKEDELVLVLVLFYCF